MDGVTAVRQILSGFGVWAVLGALVFGAGWAVVSPASPALATDNATYLGVIEVDCQSGQLLPQTIVYSGGVGDTFKLLSASDTCAVGDSNNVLSNEPATLVAGVVSPAITVVSAGDFTVTDAGSNAVSFRTFAGPVFGNHNRGALPEQTIEFTCNGTSDDFESAITIYFQETGETFKLENESSSRSCSFADPSNILTGEPASLDTQSTSGSITIDGSGAFTATTSNSTPRTITFTVIEGKQPDIGVLAGAGFSVSYPDSFYSVNTGVVDARVTITDVDNLDAEANHNTSPDLKMNQLDESVSPDSGNWALSPAIDVFGSGNNIVNQGSSTFEIEFFESGTTTPVTLTNLSVTIIDIDFAQYISAPDVTTLQLSSSPASVLEASTSGNVLTVRDPLDQGSSDSDQQNWVVMNFSSASSLEFTVGAINGRSASFGLSFAPAPWSTNPTTLEPAPVSGAAAAQTSSQQAIHLELLGSAGTRVDATSALIEGQGLLPGSTYSLRLGPGGQSLKSGQVLSGGRFSHQIPLPPGLAPGTYFVELQATGRDGAVLVLSQRFAVGTGGVLSQVSPAAPGSSFQGSLANTGPDAALSLSLGVSITLFLLGFVSLWVARSRRFALK
jgi:hypothetical protein